MGRAQVRYDYIDSVDHPLHGAQCQICGYHKFTGSVLVVMYHLRACKPCLERILDDAPSDASEQKIRQMASSSRLFHWIRGAPEPMESL